MESVSIINLFAVLSPQSNDIITCILQAPHCCHMRSPLKMGDVKLVDTMMLDGLMDAFHDYHMGITGQALMIVLLHDWHSKCLSVKMVYNT